MTVSFFNASDRTAIGDLDQLSLSVCPRVGETVRFVYDDQGGTDGFVFQVKAVEHNLIRNLSGSWQQIVDVFLYPETDVS